MFYTLKHLYLHINMQVSLKFDLLFCILSIFYSRSGFSASYFTRSLDINRNNNRKKERADKKEAGGDEKLVYFFTWP